MKKIKWVIYTIFFFALSATFLNMQIYAATDKSILETKNNVAIVAYYEERESYTASSYQLFKTAVNAYGNYLYVNSVIADDTATQTEVDQLIQKIDDALNLLVLKADNSELIELYNNVSSIGLEGYTSSSKLAFENEMSRIYLLIMSDDLDSSLAAQTLLDLQNAHDLLVELPDMTELQNLCDQAATYREEDYSVSSFGALEIAIDNALAVINDDDASQSEVDNVQNKLSIAIENLSNKEEIIYLAEGNSLNLSQFITKGDANIVSYTSSNNSILSVNNSGIATGNAYGLVDVNVKLDNGIEENLQIKVKAKVSVPVIALTISIPFVGIAVGTSVIFMNKDAWLNILNKAKKIVKK